MRKVFLGFVLLLILEVCMALDFKSISFDTHINMYNYESTYSDTVFVINDVSYLNLPCTYCYVFVDKDSMITSKTAEIRSSNLKIFLIYFDKWFDRVNAVFPYKYNMYADGKSIADIDNELKNAIIESFPEDVKSISLVMGDTDLIPIFKQLSKDIDDMTKSFENDDIEKTASIIERSKKSVKPITKCQFVLNCKGEYLYDAEFSLKIIIYKVKMPSQ